MAYSQFTALMAMVCDRSVKGNDRLIGDEFLGGFEVAYD
jgi:hypothetical protein